MRLHTCSRPTVNIDHRTQGIGPAAIEPSVSADPASKHRSDADDNPSVISTLQNIEIHMAMACIASSNVAGVAALLGLCFQACKVGSDKCQMTKMLKLTRTT